MSIAEFEQVNFGWGDGQTIWGDGNPLMPGGNKKGQRLPPLKNDNFLKCVIRGTG